MTTNQIYETANEIAEDMTKEQFDDMKESLLNAYELMGIILEIAHDKGWV